ncbi:ankyrin repeat domain-containing protein [Wolbachia endosymbiont of Madathamugadia hiepei]|uniref:ankyrin repeat domain-containing protein n=1 Tax=Wolbachia endosymbiont of Madathamugadia hiepei TaxID=1241303 RepID=UPI001FECEF8B|nr:ankyrin repeat domain-containing protein [Wolbachia endosymbiont of Madathamugadia hiepei]
MEQKKLAEILKEINALPDLSAGNVIEQIKIKLQEDKETYEKWGKEDDINYRLTTDCDTLLDIAVENGCIKIVEALLAKGANVNSGIYAPLHTAIIINNKEMVEILIKYKADVNLKNKYDGFTPLHLAVEGDHQEIAEILIKHKANVNLKDDDGLTPLHLAAKEGHKEMVETLIKYKANINLRGRKGRSPLHFAAKEGDTDIVKILIKTRQMLT